MKKELNMFREYLRQNHLKITPQRIKIAEFVLNDHRHLSAEDIYALLSRTKNISRASVYRTLELLSRSKLVDKTLHAEDKKAIYEHVVGHGHHDHLYCLKCQKVFEFYNDKLESLQDQIARTRDFKVSFHSLKIYGICSRCHKDRNNR
ncbi:MAG: Fur family transcriptional regulator [bacterium]